MPKNNTTTNDSSHQPGKNRVPIASDTDGNEKPGKSATLFFQFLCTNSKTSPHLDGLLTLISQIIVRME